MPKKKAGNRPTDTAPDEAVAKTPLTKLKKAWKKADAEQRASFLEWISSAEIAAGALAPRNQNAIPVSSGRYLRPAAIGRIREVMAARKLDTADVMEEMGFDPQDPSLHRAMNYSHGLRLVIIEALEKWLAEQAGK